MNTHTLEEALMRPAAVIVLMALAASAMADELATGFETPDFTPGFVGGQSGWLAYDNNLTQPLISSTNPFAGDQHVRIGKEQSLQSGDPVGAFSPIVAQAQGSDTLMSVLVNISNSGGASYDVIAQSVSEDSHTGRVQFFWADFDGDGLNGDILVLDAAGFVDTGYDYLTGEYRELRIEAFGTTGSLDYYYDDQLIYSTSLVLGGTLIEQVVLQADNFQTDDYADFDNFAIIPAPATLAVIGAGLMLVRRRR